MVLPLWTKSSEQGKYDVSNEKVDLGTKGEGILVSSGFLGLGVFNHTTTINAGELVYKLTSNSTDAAVVLGELNTITLGPALKTEGEGTLSYLGHQFTTNSMSGSSFFDLGVSSTKFPFPFCLRWRLWLATKKIG